MQQATMPLSQMPHIDIKSVQHPLLSRLIKEMQDEPELLAMPSSHDRYDRMHNRHNRG